MFYGVPLLLDPTWLILIPGIILALYAQARVNGAFNRYSQIRASSGCTGASAARRMLDENGLYDVPVQPAQGRLSDHYDPRRRTLNLSQGVHDGASLAALGVAAHEVGHAVQHSRSYMPMALRQALVPAANIGSYGAWPLLIAGLLLGMPLLVEIGIAVFGIAVVFQLVTLPVEYNASHRGLELLKDGGFLQEDEIAGARKVLSAAALTYLSATLMAILQLLRLILIANGGRRRD